MIKVSWPIAASIVRQIKVTLSFDWRATKGKSHLFLPSLEFGEQKSNLERERILAN